MRISRDKHFIELATKIAERGTCSRAKVGAIAIKDNRIIASAYNGSVSRGKHCEDVGCIIVNDHCVRSMHAEMNIVCACAKFGTSLKDTTIYCTLEPCYSCLMALVSAGVTKVIYKDSYPDKRINPELYKLIEVEQYGGII